jgi:protein SCO1
MRIGWISNSITIGLVILLASCNNQIANKEQVNEIKQSTKLLLPVFGESRLGANKDTLYHMIADFNFVNQFGDTVTNKTIHNKVYVADFFFATCESICPKMSTQLERVQTQFLKDTNFLILSHTVNPSNDNVSVLSTYGKQYNAVKGKWHLMTGNKKQIYDLAKSSYLVNALEDDGSEQGFLHSETFLLIDYAKRIRGIYDGTDSIDVNRLIKDITILKTEAVNEKR